LLLVAVAADVLTLVAVLEVYAALLTQQEAELDLKIN
jgi:hypothetical protein